MDSVADCLLEFVTARLAIVVLETIVKMALFIGLVAMLHAIGGVPVAWFAL